MVHRPLLYIFEQLEYSLSSVVPIARGVKHMTIDGFGYRERYMSGARVLKLQAFLAIDNSLELQGIEVETTGQVLDKRGFEQRIDQTHGCGDVTHA